MDGFFNNKRVMNAGKEERKAARGNIPKTNPIPSPIPVPPIL